MKEATIMNHIMWRLDHKGNREIMIRLINYIILKGFYFVTSVATCLKKKKNKKKKEKKVDAHACW